MGIAGPVRFGRIPAAGPGVQQQQKHIDEHSERNHSRQLLHVHHRRRGFGRRGVEQHGNHYQRRSDREPDGDRAASAVSHAQAEAWHASEAGAVDGGDFPSAGKFGHCLSA